MTAPVETPSTETAPTPPEGQEPEGNGEAELTLEQAKAEIERHKAELTRTRGEAANWRTKLRDAEKQLTDAKTPEEFEAAKQELIAQNAKLERDLLVARISHKHSLPDDLAALLQGADEAALEAHAASLAKYVTTPAPDDLGGGLDGGHLDEAAESTDPRVQQKKYGRGAKR